MQESRLSKSKNCSPIQQIAAIFYMCILCLTSVKSPFAFLYSLPYYTRWYTTRNKQYVFELKVHTYSLKFVKFKTSICGSTSNWVFYFNSVKRLFYLLLKSILFLSQFFIFNLYSITRTSNKYQFWFSLKARSAHSFY